MRQCWGVVAAGLFWALPARAGGPALVPAGGYADLAEREIDGARRSVDLFLYLFGHQPENPGAGPSRLMEALLRAHRRGVAVTVLLDPGEQIFDRLDRNLAAADALRRAGVPVRYTQGRLLHAKVLVVDGRTVLLGSSNWTTAAFQANAEADVFFASEKVARDLLARMSALARRDPPDFYAGGEVRLPAAFLFPPGTMGEMVRRKDAAGFDLYLHFLSLGVSTAAFTPVDVPLAARVLNGRDEGPVANRRKLHKVFRRLRDFYGLADVQETYGRDPAVRLRDLPGGAVRLPRAYFTQGWDRRLSLSGKVFLLIHLYRSAASPVAPQWSRSRRALARDHGIAPWTVSLGVVDLRRNNLVEVIYDDLPTEADPARRPNRYLPVPFYDPAVLEERFRLLAARFGPAALARARAAAHLLYEDADADIVERLIALEADYGRHTLAKALRLLGQKNPDNPKRSFGYLVGLVKGLAKGDAL